ncbi:outer membrane beta-barrel protein [Limimaricola sp.]|uniref:outer membrane protein n=1 Tax=Limimaricola sp. TaxID=2211665 RepID=UPI0025C04699|nr:outer membrane beta-barrel protein [Limimaricola sp.]
MIKTRIILAALPALLAAPAAFAGGMAAPVVTPAPVAPAPVMTPPPSDWTGFYIGADVGTGTGKSASFPDVTGTVYGIHAGYNYDLGNFVLGAEGSYAKTDLSYSGYKLDSMSLLKVKAGYDLGQFMPYITAGVGNYSTTGTLAATDNGTLYGVGADMRLTSNLFANVEYLRHKSTDFAGTGTDVTLDTLTAGVSFKF